RQNTVLKFSMVLAGFPFSVVVRISRTPAISAASHCGFKIKLEDSLDTISPPKIEQAPNFFQNQMPVKVPYPVFSVSPVPAFHCLFSVAPPFLDAALPQWKALSVF